MLQQKADRVKHPGTDRWGGTHHLYHGMAMGPYRATARRACLRTDRDAWAHGDRISVLRANTGLRREGCNCTERRLRALLAARLGHAR
jgi:hypothetical protein